MGSQFVVSTCTSMTTRENPSTTPLIHVPHGFIFSKESTCRKEFGPGFVPWDGSVASAGLLEDEDL